MSKNRFYNWFAQPEPAEEIKQPETKLIWRQKIMIEFYDRPYNNVFDVWADYDEEPEKWSICTDLRDWFLNLDNSHPETFLLESKEMDCIFKRKDIRQLTHKTYEVEKNV